MESSETASMTLDTFSSESDSLAGGGLTSLAALLVEGSLAASSGVGSLASSSGISPIQRIQLNSTHGLTYTFVTITFAGTEIIIP